jgi:signal transduction histidine kinase/ligand-binding sensor domain-containing protein/DNA-binding response OmpR family regulator
MRAVQISFIVLWSFYAGFAFGQEPAFRHLSIDDGLSQNAVYSIIQDSQGFMWFGTKDGLNRYDGRNFVVYQHNPFDSTTISDAYVSKLMEDRHGRIWTGSISGDINILHRDTDFFCEVPMENERGNRAITNEITDIIEAPDGSVWIATKGDGLFNLKVTSEVGCNYDYEQFLHNPANSSSLYSNRVGNLLFDEYQTFWVGTEEGLNQFIESNGSFIRTRFNTKHPDAPISTGDHKITSMHIDLAGQFWIGVQSGLVKFNRPTGDYEFFPNQYEVIEYGWGSVNRISEDNNGNLWLGTVAGLMMFNPTTEQYSYYRHDPLNPRSISHNIISSLLIDRSNILWAGTSGLGINILDFNANRFPTLSRTPHSSSRITGFSIRSILEDNAGDVWISADVLYRWNRKTGELFSFEADSDLIQNFGNTNAYSIVEASSGFLWFASTEGLFRHNPVTNQTRLYSYSSGRETGLLQQEVNAVFEDKTGSIWVATHSHFSKLIDEQSGTFKHYNFNSSEYSIGIARPVIYQDIDGNFWVGTSHGLSHFNPNNNQFTNYINDPSKTNSLSNNLVKSILEDPKEPETYLWIGTSGGLNKFNYRTGEFRHYTVQDGLPNEVIYGILPDNDGNLWLSTNKGLSRFNPETNTFRNFDVFDGLQSNEFNTGAYYRSDSGELFFGGIQGLNYFFPEEINDNPHQPPIVLTGLKKGAETVTFKKEPGLLDAAVSMAEKINLSYRDDVITFEFAALDYAAPEKNQYAYKLDGYNEDWISSGNLGSATYTNLPPGEYVFRVKGSNNDGVWNEDGLALAVAVAPPFWRTIWAYLIYGLLFFVGFYSLRRYELNRFNLKNQLKLERVQTESLRKLDHLKSDFFANISHEFRTPLTLIVGHIDNVLEEDIDTSTRQKLNMATKNANRLLSLINQLLDLSKLEAGKMTIQTSTYNIVPFLKSLLYSFESLAASRNISLNFVAHSGEICVSFDADKLERVFFNLISNAIKFTESGGSVTLSLESTDDDRVCITVADTGIGISESRLPYIFDRFYQVDSSSTRNYEGSGIGLAIVNEFIKLHDGSISVESTRADMLSEGKSGTTFKIHLPLSEASSNEHEPSLEAGTFHNPPGIHGHATDQNLLNFNSDKEILLLAEDNPEVREFIREQLEEDYWVIEASNGKEALELSEKEIPDLIISDLMMPEMDGLTFCKKIRQNEKTSHIPVIMLTAKASQESKLESLESGIDAFITKPFKVNELKIRVRKLIEQRKKLREQFSTSAFLESDTPSVADVDREFLAKTVQLIEDSFSDENFKVSGLASTLNMSTSQFNRKLHGLVGQSPVQFIISVRLQRASKLLKVSNKTIAEIAYEVGYSDQAYFSRVFKKEYGVSPSEYKNNL